MIRQLHQISGLLLLAAMLPSMPVWAGDQLKTGGASAWQRYQLRHVDASMGETEYRQAFRKNRKQVQNFIENYAEANLTSLGIPRKGLYFLGAVASVAATQDAKFYLSKSKLMAVEVKNAAEDNRSIYLGFKVNW